jgi:nicotinamidase-related amidase
MRAALCIIDMQKGFLENRTTYPSLADALEYINAAVELFNNHSLPVFVVQDEDARDEEGADSFDLVDGLTPDIPGDHRVCKKYCNSFWKTDLEERLTGLNVGFVVLAGFAAEACINFTYNGAQERGFHAVILKNAVLSYKDSHVRFVTETANVISYSTLGFLLSQGLAK